jgi:hypothetical protein
VLPLPLPVNVKSPVPLLWNVLFPPDPPTKVWMSLFSHLISAARRNILSRRQDHPQMKMELLRRLGRIR